MGQEELICLTVPSLILLFVVVGIVAGNRKRTSLRNATIRQLLEFVDRLSRTPDHGPTIERLVAATSTRSWVPTLPDEPARDLWKRAIQFAFANIRSTSGETIAYSILVPLSSSPARDTPPLMSAIRQAIAESPSDRRIHQIVLNCLRAMTIESNQQRWLYDRVLDLVQQSPNSVDLSVLALELGRWHLGKSRADGRVTVYDESAIQNDIAVRRGMA